MNHLDRCRQMANYSESSIALSRLLQRGRSEIAAKFEIKAGRSQQSVSTCTSDATGNTPKDSHKCRPTPNLL
eukprot:3567310-Amphidinium_carterae.1